MIRISEVVEEIARLNGMSAIVEPTAGFFQAKVQGGLTDWAFIRDVLAKEATPVNKAKRVNTPFLLPPIIKL